MSLASSSSHSGRRGLDDADPPLRIDVARNIWQRTRGLLGRRSLSPREGLLIEGCSSIHTCFMRFPIDVIYLDREGRVVKIVSHLAPWRFSSARGARSTLELAAGACARNGIAVGDVIAGQAA